MQETPIRIIVDGRTIEGTLSDNAAAASLIDQLPLTLTFEDFNSVEKTGRLPEALSMEGMPDGDDPEIGDIGYYLPDRVLVLYYGDVGHWNGIARLGRFDADPSVIEGLPDGASVTIEEAN